jgi:hypothetical protein
MPETTEEDCVKKTLLIVTLTLLLAAPAGATVMLSRSSGMLKPFQVLAFVPLAYSQTAKSYDWTAGEYVPLADNAKTSSLDAGLLAGVGLPFRFEVCGFVPVAAKSKDTLTSSGIGDATAMIRWGVLQSKLLPVRATLIGAVNLPTAKEGASPSLGDRTMDVGVGLAANTIKLGIIAAHLRAAYWFNGEDANAVQAGNFLEYIVFVETPFRPSFSPYLGVTGVMAGKTQVNGIETDNTQKSQHSVTFGITSKPLSFLPLWVKPKASIPLTAVSEGGTVPDFGLGLDLWTALP